LTANAITNAVITHAAGQSTAIRFGGADIRVESGLVIINGTLWQQADTGQITLRYRRGALGVEPYIAGMVY
ncbi:MAG: hypothetical protein LBS18_00915, partial [Clostridiales bacterium]|nr:hypothetical protein [Clostridiales bacterium]